VKKSFIKRILCLGLLSVSLLGFGSIGASAEWRQDNGKWYYYNQQGQLMVNGWIDDKYYVGSDGAWIKDKVSSNNNGTNSNTIPITIPTTWNKLGDNKYSINNRSVVSYSVTDMTGWTQESVLNDLKKIAYQQGNYDSENGLVTYNGNNGYAYCYTSLTKESLTKVLCIVIFKNNKHYDFVFVSNYNNYQTDRKSLENVLNASLNI
jgi:hypothetical protein